VKEYDSQALTATFSSTEITVKLSQMSLTDRKFWATCFGLSYSGQTESIREVAHLQIPQILISVSF